MSSERRILPFPGDCRDHGPGCNDWCSSEADVDPFLNDVRISAIMRT